MANARILKLNHHLRDEVSKILQGVFNPDGVLVTVIDADISPTLEHVTIKISIFPKNKEKQILIKLKNKIYPIQQILNRRLVMRPVPKIRFEIDHSQENIDRIEKILQKDAEK